ncbi:MAG: hypothetical protein KUG77_05400 [Nannocystaceae bacterium]|nr:hypothetical protein [Nannocystaceae bacterium]
MHSLGSVVASNAASFRAALAVCLISLALAGCDGDAKPTNSVPARPDASVAAVEMDPDAPRFEVHVEATAKAAPGKEALAKVHVEAHKPWHMNTEFPVALRMKAPNGVTLEVPKQRKDDAERFDDEELVFALPFTPTSDGRKQFAGEIDFAVCGDAACAPETVLVDFTIDVGCDSGALC